MESARELFEHELAGAHDAAARAAKALPGVARKTSDERLGTLLEELSSATREQVDRLGKIFDALDRPVAGEPSKPARAMLDEMTSTAKQARAPEVVDVVVAESASDVAQYLQSTYEMMLQLAERSGLTHSTPEIGEMLEPSLKEAKRSTRRLQKQVEKLVQTVRPN